LSQLVHLHNFFSRCTNKIMKIIIVVLVLFALLSFSFAEEAEVLRFKKSHTELSVVYKHLLRIEARLRKQVKRAEVSITKRKTVHLRALKRLDVARKNYISAQNVYNKRIAEISSSFNGLKATKKQKSESAKRLKRARVAFKKIQSQVTRAKVSYELSVKQKQRLLAIIKAELALISKIKQHMPKRGSKKAKKSVKKPKTKKNKKAKKTAAPKKN